DHQLHWVSALFRCAGMSSDPRHRAGRGAGPPTPWRATPLAGRRSDVLDVPRDSVAPNLLLDDPREPFPHDAGLRVSPRRWKRQRRFAGSAPDGYPVSASGRCPMKRWSMVFVIAVLAGIGNARAEGVDLLLVLAADVSRSIDDGEFE